MKVVNKRFDKWPSKIRKQLRNLSLRDAGVMSKVANCSDTFVAFKNDLIIGWGIYSLSPVFINFYLYDVGSYMLYVRKLYRKMGIGKRLIKAASNKYGTLMIYPWDENSGKFFHKILDEEKLKVSRGFEWIQFGEQL